MLDRRYLIVGVLLLATVVHAQAECIQPPPCARISPNSPIYLATVTEILEENSTAMVRVDEVFWGKPPATVKLFVGGMQVGQQYIVDDTYGFGDSVLLDPNCTGGGKVEDRADDIRFFRAFAKGEPLTRVSGGIQDDGKPVAGITVVLTGLSGRYRARTNAEGLYEFRAIPGGEYRAAVQPEAGPPQVFEESVTVIEHACTRVAVEDLEPAPPLPDHYEEFLRNKPVLLEH